MYKNKQTDLPIQMQHRKSSEKCLADPFANHIMMVTETESSAPLISVQ